MQSKRISDGRKLDHVPLQFKLEFGLWTLFLIAGLIEQ